LHGDQHAACEILREGQPRESRRAARSPRPARPTDLTQSTVTVYAVVTDTPPRRVLRACFRGWRAEMKAAALASIRPLPTRCTWIGHDGMLCPTSQDKTCIICGKVQAPGRG
jgi:hypothetical protein